MSHIDDLIQRLCPNGVEHKMLGSQVEVLDYRRSPVTRSARVPGTVPYYGANGIQDYVAESIFDSTLLLLGEDGSVVNTDGSPMLHWVTGPSWVNNHAHVLTQATEGVDLRFLYHFLQTVDIRPLVRGVPPKLNQRNMREVLIAVPPLEVQREIVRILDLFQSLEAELEAELEARRRQYAHYRDSLLASPAGEVRWVPLGELGEMFRGRRFTKADYVEDGVAALHYGQIYTHYGTSATRPISRVRPEMAPTLRFARPGDVVIAEVGETVDDVGKAVAWLGTEDIAVHDGCFVLRHDQNPKYLAYCLQTRAFHAEKNQYVSRAKLSRLLFGGLKSVRVPIPPLEEQDRIVRVLDKFDALVNDLSVGLPAELAARRRQYEHYRDRLLTFEEAS